MAQSSRVKFLRGMPTRGIDVTFDVRNDIICAEVHPMSTYSLRIDNDLKARLEKRAKESNKSLNQLLVEYINIGRTLDKYVDKDSQVLVKHATGFAPDQPILIPVSEMLGR